jgi:hypothetical protein
MRSAVMASYFDWPRFRCFLQERTRGIETKEQITDRTPQQIRDLPACHVMRAILDEVAALTEALEVPHPIIARVMVKVCCRKNDPRLAQMDSLHEIRPAREPAMVVSPGLSVAVEPAAIRQAPDYLAVWPAASFANAACPTKAHASADVRPVAWIEPTEFGLDRHRHLISFERLFCGVKSGRNARFFAASAPNNNT